MIREGQLETVVTMRSNDAFRGLPHDAFSFTMIQEIMARILGHELGTYTQFVGSLHLYDSDLQLSRQYLEEGWQPTQRVAMPPMPRLAILGPQSRLCYEQRQQFAKEKAYMIR